MSQPIYLLCLVISTYFFIPVLSDRWWSPPPPPGQYPHSRQYPNPGQYPHPRQYPNPGQYPHPRQYPNPGQYPHPRPYPDPGQYPNPGQYPYPGQYPDPGQYPNPGQNPGPAQMPGTVRPNPCPNIFRYVKGKNGEIEGRITVPADYQHSVLTLKVNGSMLGYYGKKNNMMLALLTPYRTIYLKQTPTFEYQVIFPTQVSIPRIVEVKLNEKVHCSGPTEELQIGGEGITNMHSIHDFYFFDKRNQVEMLDDDDYDIAGNSYIESDDSDAQYGLL